MHPGNTQLMHFPSIFCINGEAIVARIDNKCEKTSINCSLQVWLGLTSGDSIFVLVPIGSSNHTCSTIVIVGEHAEDIILGTMWLWWFSTDALQVLHQPEGVSVPEVTTVYHT